MGLTLVQLQEKSIKKLVEYIKEHGKKCNGKSVKIYWDTYPICVMDICTLSAVLEENDKLVFCNYDVEKDFYKKDFCRNATDLRYTYLNSILEDMIEADSNK